MSSVVRLCDGSVALGLENAQRLCATSTSIGLKLDASGSQIAQQLDAFCVDTAQRLGAIYWYTKHTQRLWCRKRRDSGMTMSMQR